MLQNIVAYNVEAIAHSIVGITQHSKSQLTQIVISFAVGFFSLWGEMLDSIDLDYHSMTCDEEINDIVADDFLSIDCYGQAFQKIIPKVLFFGSHVISECLGYRSKFSIVFSNHIE